MINTTETFEEILEQLMVEVRTIAVHAENMAQERVKLANACVFALVSLEKMTTEEFTRGADRPVRLALRKALGMPDEEGL